MPSILVQTTRFYGVWFKICHVQNFVRFSLVHPVYTEISLCDTVTNLRVGGTFISSFLCGLFIDATVKIKIKLVYIRQNYRKNNKIEKYSTEGSRG